MKTNKVSFVCEQDGPVERQLKQELIAEVLANAYCAFKRLVDRNKVDLAYPTPLAYYAIRQVRSGRRVGGHLNAHDVSSRRCQLTKGVIVEQDHGGLRR